MHTLLRWSGLVLFPVLFSCGEPGPADETNEAGRTAVLSESPSLTASLHAACPTDMVAVAGFCMDRYEAPNQPGVAPLAMQTAKDAADFCAARKKRMCTEAEWVRACQGPAKLPYPYGTSYQRSRCNDDKVWKVPSWSTLATWPSAAAGECAAWMRELLR